MRIFTTLPQENLAKVGAAAQAIEATGYTGVSTQENRHEPFLSLAVAGAATKRIELHTGVAIAFARSPMTVANVGWDLAASFGGARVTLGIGSQVRAHNERRFSVPWTAPAPRIREYVQAVRAIWAAWKGDGKLNYEGKHYRFTLMTPNFVPEPYDGPLPGGRRRRRPHLLKVAAEESDDVKAPFILHEEVSRAEHHAHPDGGLAARGRQRESFEISAAASSSPARTTPRSPSCSTGCAIVWRSTARPGLLASLRRAWLGRSRPQAQRHDAAGQWDQIGQGSVRRHRPPVRRRPPRPDRQGHHRALRGLVDSIGASANSAKPSDMPPDLLQDLARIPTVYRHA